MAYRIYPIRGNSLGSRRARLESTRRWLAHRGWHLVEFAEQTGQAMFEQSGASGSHAGRIYPWEFPPGYWSGLLEEWLVPRRLVLIAAVAVVAAALIALNAGRSKYDPEQTAKAFDARWRIVSVDTLNVREQANPNSQIVGLLFKSQRVLIGERQGDWMEIVQPQRGFVAAQFLDEPKPKP